MSWGNMSNSKAETVKLKSVTYVLGHSKQVMRFFTMKDIVRSPCVATVLVSPDSTNKTLTDNSTSFVCLVCTQLLHKAEIQMLLSKIEVLKSECQELWAELQTTIRYTICLQATKAPNLPPSNWRCLRALRLVVHSFSLAVPCFCPLF